jgi:Ni,Fe-hydrogenase III large subunit
MGAFDALLATGQQAPSHRPWPRFDVDRGAWQSAAEQLAAGTLTLVSLWGDGRFVHMAVRDETDSRTAILTLACPDGQYPSVGMHHPPAIRLERAARDLYGLEPDGLPDTRPWLDHGTWGLSRPLDPNGPSPPIARGYEFLSAEGEGLHQIPVGPVHAGIIEPGHFRFSAAGETIVRLEERLGYAHKGIDGLMAGATIAKAAGLAGRMSGDSTVAFALAFARAVEAALGVDVPLRAIWLRALMTELERIANHFGDIGAICNDAAFSLMHVQCGALRERVLRFANAAFGHRLMRDRIIPGGVATDLPADMLVPLRALLALVRKTFPELIELYDNTASLQDRTVSTGILSAELAQQFGAGGYVGRASGRAFDARRAVAYPPYDRLAFEAPVLDDGDVNARVWIRIREVEQSLLLIDQIVAALPEGPLAVASPQGGGEGAALVEGFRGDIFCTVRIRNDGRIERCHLRDPSWFQWPLLEAVIENNIVADFPLCNKSFNCSYSGHDL